MNNFDYYGVAEEIISRMENEGHAAEAANLRGAMEEGATGTEIFMALRFHLAGIVRRKILKGDLSTMASTLLERLTDALK